MSSKATPTIAQDPENPIDEPILAVALVRISDAFGKLLRSGLNRRAVITLIKADTGLSVRDITAVLDSLDGLRKSYTTADL